MTTTEAIDKWIEHEKFNTSYGRTVRNILHRNLGGLFPFIDASTLTEEHVSKGIDSMRTRNVSERYINIFRQLAYRFVSFATGKSIASPASQSKKKDKKKLYKPKKKEYFTEEEEIKIREAIPRLPLKSLYQFSLETGISSAMARVIHQENVDIEKGTILLKEKVNRDNDCISQLSPPVIYKMDDEIKPLVSKLMNGRKYLFCIKENEFVKREEVRRNDLMLKLLTGISHVTLYSLAEYTMQKRRIDYEPIEIHDIQRAC